MLTQWITSLTVLVLSISGCAVQPQLPWQIKVTQMVGGEYQAVCLTTDYVALKSAFEIVVLQLDQGQSQLQKTTSSHDKTSPAISPRLKRIHRVQLPQFIKPSAMSVVTPSGHIPSSKSLSLDSGELCSDGAWLSLGTQGQLKTRWAGRELMVTRYDWRWGIDRRERITRLRDLARLPRSHPAAYLIATERGLWRWTQGRTQALSEPLPDVIPSTLSRIVMDGHLWWVHSPDLSRISSQHIPQSRSLAWPLQMGSGPIRLVGGARSAPPPSRRLLAPISGHALRGKRAGLFLVWDQQRYPVPPLSTLCVLSPQVVAVATSKGVSLWVGPLPSQSQSGSNSANSEHQLHIAAHLKLPADTSQLLCERSSLIMIGDYGLLYAELQPFSTTRAQP